MCPVHEIKPLALASEVNARHLTSEAKAKAQDLTSEAKYLTSKAKQLIYLQGQGLNQWGQGQRLTFGAKAKAKNLTSEAMIKGFIS